MRTRAFLACCAVSAALASSAHGADNKTVSAGLPSEKLGEKFFDLNGDVNAFFPRTVKINAGDTVEFAANGFHSFNIPARTAKAYDLLVPGDPVTGVNDEAGQAFWFNGQPAFGFNPNVFGPSNFGKSLTYSPSETIESGAPLGQNLKPMKVTFPKKGSITYFCDIHPGMKGVVKILPKKARATSLKQHNRLTAIQVKRSFSELKRIRGFKPGSGVVQIGAAGKRGVESFDFFPAKPKVSVGTTLKFQMPRGSTEVHTASTGPGNPLAEEDGGYLRELSGSFQGPAPDPRAVYPSEQPGGTPASLTSTLHGNGFWNSGVLDAVAASPLPRDNQVTFAEAGSFDFFCLIHPFMKTTVTVTP